MTFLADSNILIARNSPSHEFHLRAATWFASISSFAVCPITEGALARYLKWQFPGDPKVAGVVLDRLSAARGYEFWPDDLSYRDVDLAMLRGHKQVTDAYLVALARSKGGRLATFDEALAAMYPDVELIPT